LQLRSSQFVFLVEDADVALASSVTTSDDGAQQLAASASETTLQDVSISENHGVDQLSSSIHDGTEEGLYHDETREITASSSQQPEFESLGDHSQDDSHEAASSSSGSSIELLDVSEDGSDHGSISTEQQKEEEELDNVSDNGLLERVGDQAVDGEAGVGESPSAVSMAMESLYPVQMGCGDSILGPLNVLDVEMRAGVEEPLEAVVVEVASSEKGEDRLDTVGEIEENKEMEASEDINTCQEKLIEENVRENLGDPVDRSLEEALKGNKNEAIEHSGDMLRLDTADDDGMIERFPWKRLESDDASFVEHVRLVSSLEVCGL